MDQDWTTETEPANPDGDDIVIKDGLLHFVPEGAGVPYRAGSSPIGRDLPAARFTGVPVQPEGCH